MLEDRQIQTLMKQVAAGIIPAAQLLDVRTEPALDAEGKDALRITLVITDDVAQTLTGAQLGHLLLDVHDSLLKQGDERFPLISYATPTDSGEADDD